MLELSFRKILSFNTTIMYLEQKDVVYSLSDSICKSLWNCVHSSSMDLFSLHINKQPKEITNTQLGSITVFVLNNWVCIN